MMVRRIFLATAVAGLLTGPLSVAAVAGPLDDVQEARCRLESDLGIVDYSCWAPPPVDPI